MGVGTKAELTATLETKSRALQDLIDSDAVIGQIDGEKVELKQDGFTAATQLKSDIENLVSLLELRDLTDAPAEQGKAGQANAQLGNRGGNGLESKSLGEMFLDSTEFNDMLKMKSTTMDRAWTSPVFGWTEGLSYKDVYSAQNPITLSPGVGQEVQWDPVVPRAMRTNRIRSLFPVATTDADIIAFFRGKGFVENSGDGAAALVPERSGGNFASKPHSNVQWESDSVMVGTIAHWEIGHRNVLLNRPQIRATIDTELRYGLALVEDYQILWGDGIDPNLLGIMNTPGIQSYTAPPAETRSDSVRRAMTKAALAFYPSTGVVLHPNDWEGIEIQKDGEQRYMITTQVSLGAETRLWRVPVVETPVMDEGKFLTGGFGLAAQLYDREQVNIRISEHHANVFIQNAIVVLCEERLAVTVKRPESMVSGTFV
jgi:HK97 family phage major capsid protein